MNFNSQICTSRKQSERLVALGLKKETADMYWRMHHTFEGEEIWRCYADYPVRWGVNNMLPAWSFGRLLEIFLESDSYRNILFVHNEDHMEYLLRHIEIYIKEGLLDERYLEE